MNRIGLILTTLTALAIFVLWANRVTQTPSLHSAETSKENKPVSPDFTLKDLEGRDIRLSQFKGKVVLVNFWATWCGPCRIEIPWLIELQDKYGTRGFTVRPRTARLRIVLGHTIDFVDLDAVNIKISARV